MRIISDLFTDLSTAKSQQAIRSSVLALLESEEGRSAIVSALAREKIDAAVDDIFGRLSDKLLSDVTTASHEATIQFEEILKGEAQRLSRTAVTQLRGRGMEQVETLKTRLNDALRELLERHGDALIRDALQTFVRSRPIAHPGWTNRQIAAAHGISIREVKRRRRSGDL